MFGPTKTISIDVQTKLEVRLISRLSRQMAAMYKPGAKNVYHINWNVKCVSWFYEDCEQIIYLVFSLYCEEKAIKVKVSFYKLCIANQQLQLSSIVDL